MGSLRFEPLHYADRITVVNPLGDVGLLTLWSTGRATRRVLERVAPGLLDPARSRIAAIANLYGDGLHQMLGNLAHNPQIRHLVAVGEQLDLPTVDELEAFLAHGVEPAEMLGTPVLRIPGTGRVLPAMPGLDADGLRSRLTFRYCGRIGELTPELGDRIAALPRHDDSAAERRRVELPDPTPSAYSHLPSDVMMHQVSRRRPLAAWRELVTRTVRFGTPAGAPGHERRELLNARAVVTDPGPDDDADLDAHGVDPARLRAYQAAMLDGTPPADGDSYTYGHRLRGYFARPGGNRDALAAVAELLTADPHTRRAYLSLWDTATDLTGSEAATPCLVGVFFRRAHGRLTLTASYRAHNLLTAWLPNVYGLMAVQAWVAEATGIPVGPLTVLSHQLGIDPRSPRHQTARAVAAGWTRDEDTDPVSGKPELRRDPHGYFVVSTDPEAGEIVADHRLDGLTITRYRGRSAAAVAQQVSADMAVSLVSHGLWLGAELARAQARLPQRDHPPGPDPTDADRPGGP